MRELSNDELAKLSNDELRNLFLEVRSFINHSKKNKKECVREEIYFCYISREIANRSNLNERKKRATN